jgi:hypothetical protein
MNTRKIAVIGSFVAGAALTFAPLASADDLSATLDSEIASLNSLFESQAALAGDSADVVSSSGALDTILAADAPDAAPFTTLDYELYGPWASVLTLDPDPGAYDVFNGALVEFDDAYNTFASLLFTSDALISPADLIGVADAALDDGSLTDAALFGDFFNTGLADVTAYFTTVAAG